jgi:predicted NBD/HSP70 family sugar kinase
MRFLKTRRKPSLLERMLDQMGDIMMSEFSKMRKEMDELKVALGNLLAMVENMKVVIASNADDASKVVGMANEMDAMEQSINEAMKPKKDDGGSTGNVPD